MDSNSIFLIHISWFSMFYLTTILVSFEIFCMILHHFATSVPKFWLFYLAYSCFSPQHIVWVLIFQLFFFSKIFLQLPDFRSQLLFESSRQNWHGVKLYILSSSPQHITNSFSLFFPDCNFSEFQKLHSWMFIIFCWDILLLFPEPQLHLSSFEQNLLLEWDYNSPLL